MTIERASSERGPAATANGFDAHELEGQDAVKSLYRMWADTNQAIFYVENEQVAIADNYIASTSIYHQQVLGGSLMFNKAMSYLPGFLDERIVKRVLEAKAVKPDENAMYLYTSARRANRAFAAASVKPRWLP